MFVQSSAGYGQESSAPLLDAKLRFTNSVEASVEDVASTIYEQTGVTISYSSRTVTNTHVALSKGETTVREVLDKVFERFMVDYIVRDNKIIVAPQREKTFRVSGFCRDVVSGEALIGAAVYDTLLYIGAAANDYGFFSLKLPAGRATIRALYVGYRPQNITLDLTKDTLIDLRMTPALLIGEIDVVGDLAAVSEAQTGTISLPMDQVRQMPTIFGTSDIIRTLQMTTGVNSGEEGFGGMSVRGGSSDQNIVLLDDVPIYNPNHMLGFFTVFNSESVNSAALVKSGFPARYGGRMSSVLDVKTIEGNMEKYSGHVNVELMSSTALFSGPVIKDKMSFTISARRTYSDLLTSLIQRGRSTKYSFYFYDIMAKFNYIASPSDRLYLSFFTGKDDLSYDYNFRTIELNYSDDESRKVSINDGQSIYWGNTLVSARWNHIYGKALFSNTTVYYSRYRFNNKLESYSTYDPSTQYDSHYYSGINDLGVRIDFTWYPRSVLGTMRFGVNATQHWFNPGITLSTYKSAQENVTDSVTTTQRTTFHRAEAHAYIEEELKLGRLNANIGLHLSLFDPPNSLFVCLAPRISLCVELTKRILLNASYSDMSQFLQLMRITSINTPADIWLPVSKHLDPPHSRQFALEAKWLFGKNFSLIAEAYYKNIKDMQSCSAEPTFDTLTEQDWEDLYTSGAGDMHGIEVFLHKKTGKLSGWLGYTLSKAENRFDGINDGRWYPSDYDHRHVVQVFSTYKFNDNVDLSASWSYKTGSYYTVSGGKYSIAMPDGNTYSFTVAGDRNNIKMSDSHILNVGMNIHHRKPKTERILSFGIYNVYSRKNPLFVYWTTNDDSGAQELKQFSLIAWPWPYIKFSIKF